MEVDAELERIEQILKNSVAEIVYIKQQSYEIPVQICSKKSDPNIRWPKTGDKWEDVYSLIRVLNQDMDETRDNLLQFQQNKFQIIKEENFAPKSDKPLIDYEIIPTEEEVDLNRMRNNATKLQKQIKAFYRNKG